ncbi:HAD family hydrolase [Gordonia metallireducens]|uniref:HAD family hydrolase n=1 Tax=Gordonia metallireducens TaxID=2897779 RepID=UPI001E4E88AD|nr:haloacid dehalogenase-like hydrolase [Gordonia metallireducens]
MTHGDLSEAPTLVIFDIDGTLLDSAAAHDRVAIDVLARHGLDVLAKPWEAYRAYTDSAVTGEVYEDKHGIPADPAFIAELERLYAKEFDVHVSTGAVDEIAGARKLLAELATRRDVYGAFATGSFRALARTKLRVLGVEPDDVPLATGTEYDNRAEIVRDAIGQASVRHGIEDWRMVILGDGKWDELTARHLGIPLVGVQTGAHRFADDTALVVDDLRSVRVDTLVGLSARIEGLAESALYDPTEGDRR